MFGNNTQQQTVQEKPFVMKIIRCYLVGDERIDIWNDGTVDLLDKDLNLLEREENDPADLERIVQEFDDAINNNFDLDTNVENNYLG